ncbi:type II secretion system F family protein [Ornithinibacillus californiensis]|uniref:type II secretion system F family protein n=1 Tax=Ornithinibacillus californiensis TaxID=161536 RepID=UPI00064E05B7|nr:type II secretion system F family protein [Ornithinibacillus californiensis]
MNYQYVAKNLAGDAIKGKIEAETKELALQELEKNRLFVIEIKETPIWNKDIVLTKRVKNKEFVMFLRQYATLIHAGIPISDSTKTMAKQTESPILKAALLDIDRQLDRGESLSKAVANHPKIFPALLVNMIIAGEASGKLDEILNEMADYFEKEYRNKQRIVSALMYPSIVGVITLFLSIFLLVFVVPQFIGMFNSLGEEIPPFTQFILSLSNFAGAFWWLVLLFLAGIYVLYRSLLKKESFAYRVDKIKMKMPLFGVLVHKGALVRLTTTLSTLVNSSVPILQSVEITEEVVGNRVLKEVLRKVRKSLEIGESMTIPMKEHWAFPALVIQMVQIGEKTGTLDQMLLKAANFYEEEVEQLSTRIKTLIEPLMIIILTVIVGSIIAAVVIPMFSLFENI